MAGLSIGLKQQDELDENVSRTKLKLRERNCWHCRELGGSDSAIYNYRRESLVIQAMSLAFLIAL